ncbi:MAG: hypothetical protein H0T91_13330 [Propionibacteriaceae bacterium]|nr:hypothetical protein [Propionibacteriaceae bacterium]
MTRVSRGAPVRSKTRVKDAREEDAPEEEVGWVGSAAAAGRSDADT